VTRLTHLTITRAGVVVAALIATMALTPGVAHASAFPLSFPMSGLKPDNWGMTTARGSTNLRRNYPGIASVSCLGVRMKGYPRSSSTWVTRGRRYWDKLWCSGTTQTGKIFTLVYDAKSRTRSVIYRLINVTKEELRGGGAQTQTQPQTQPQPQGLDWLIQKAREEAVAKGSDPNAGVSSRWYQYQVDDCRMVDSITAGCVLWRWKETSTVDCCLVDGVQRELHRHDVFAILLYPSGYTLSYQNTQELPVQIICSDANVMDPLTRQWAPPCT
jgi:hypothetical protein